MLVRDGGQIGTNRRERVEEFAGEIDAGQALKAVAWAKRQRELEGSLRLFTVRGVAERKTLAKGASKVPAVGQKGADEVDSVHSRHLGSVGNTAFYSDRTA